MRIQAAIGVDARIQQHADIIAMGKNTIDKFPTQLAKVLLTLLIPEEILALLADGNVGVHTAPVHADNRFG